MDNVRVRRIVCAVDFSEFSDYALTYATEFANVFDAELHLIHVLELPFMPTYAMAGLPELSVPTDQLEEQARQHMDELTKKTQAEHANVTGVVRIGSAFLEIIRYAQELSADLVVVGTHGRTGLTHMIIGSVAEKVVRKAPCPVLSVKHPKHKFEMP